MKLVEFDKIWGTFVGGTFPALQEACASKILLERGEQQKSNQNPFKHKNQKSSTLI